MPETRENVLTGDSRVAFQDLLFAPSLAKQIHDELHRQACSFDYRLANEYFRIRDDPFLPIHDVSARSSIPNPTALFGFPRAIDSMRSIPSR